MLPNMILDREFWRGRRVLLTGHTGFKGAWMARWLTLMGSDVTGIALEPLTVPSLHDLLKTPIAKEHLTDLRDRDAIARIVVQARPQIVFHLAAQALVPESYRDPVGTLTSNVMGTVYVLEALRGKDELQAVIVATSDKVYQNDESGRALVEGDPLGGDDIYSASKAAAEILTRAYAHSFFDAGPPIVTARAGNVLGGGDWAADRLVPDIVRAACAGVELELRCPDATRPWQHVLDPVSGYLVYAQALAQRRDVPHSLNFGPNASGTLTVRQIADSLTKALGGSGWRHTGAPHFKEMHALALNASQASTCLGWHPRLDTAATLDWTVAWYKAWLIGADVAELTDQQIERFEASP